MTTPFTHVYIKLPADTVRWLSGEAWRLRVTVPAVMARCLDRFIWPSKRSCRRGFEPQAPGHDHETMMRVQVQLSKIHCEWLRALCYENPFRLGAVLAEIFNIHQTCRGLTDTDYSHVLGIPVPYTLHRNRRGVSKLWNPACKYLRALAELPPLKKPVARPHSRHSPSLARLLEPKPEATSISSLPRTKRVKPSSFKATERKLSSLGDAVWDRNIRTFSVKIVGAKGKA